MRLRVYVLGAYTNVASALMLDVTLKDRIDVYVIGYKLRDGRLHHDNFNSNGDMLASEYLLDSGAPLFLIPANLVERFGFDRGSFARAADDEMTHSKCGFCKCCETMMRRAGSCGTWL